MGKTGAEQALQPSAKGQTIRRLSSRQRRRRMRLSVRLTTPSIFGRNTSAMIPTRIEFPPHESPPGRSSGARLFGKHNFDGVVISQWEKECVESRSGDGVRRVNSEFLNKRC